MTDSYIIPKELSKYTINTNDISRLYFNLISIEELIKEKELNL